MIDTDKYEGHTPAPWKVGKSGLIEEDKEYGNVIADILYCKGMKPNQQLMADAPLLLAEVKQLREVQKKIGSLICDECGLSIEEHIRYHTENDVIAGCPFGED